MVVITFKAIYELEPNCLTDCLLHCHHAHASELLGKAFSGPTISRNKVGSSTKERAFSVPSLGCQGAMPGFISDLIQEIGQNLSVQMSFWSIGFTFNCQLLLLLLFIYFILHFKACFIPLNFTNCLGKCGPQMSYVNKQTKGQSFPNTHIMQLS